ncbi:MAG: phasin family protein [Nitriliruptorales bacterium]|nr:phasin family protein [Nitriliruptorales bacterium]
MNDALQRYLEAASGLGNLTKQRAEKIARQLVKQGEAASDQVGELVEDLLDRQRRNREAVTEMVRAETQRVVRKMGLATSTEVGQLAAEVDELRDQLAEVRAATDASEAATPAKQSKTAKKKPKKAAKAKTAAAKRATTPTAATTDDG